MRNFDLKKNGLAETAGNFRESADQNKSEFLTVSLHKIGNFLKIIRKLIIFAFHRLEMWSHTCK